ncbi:MAG: hypothetical protein ACKVRP_12055 [Bacteroidota bacterium]
MKTLLAISFFLISLVLVPSCSGTSGDGDVLELEQFVDVYVALLESKRDSTVTDSKQGSFNNPAQVMSEFGMVEEQVHRTINAYHLNPAKWREFYGLVVKRLDEKSKKASGSDTLKFNSQNRAAPSGE